MDFQESEAFLKENETKQRKKKFLLIGIVFCILLVAFLAAVIFYLKIEDAKTFKMYINNKKYATSKTFVQVEEDKESKDDIYYVNIEELSKIMGYQFQAGSIGLAEGENLYSITTKYEKIDLDLDKMTFDKYANTDTANTESRKTTETQVYGGELVVRTPADTKEIFQLENPLKKINGYVYASSSDINMLMSIAYDWSDIYRLYIYTLNNLYTNYSSIVKKAGYSNMSGDYENIRAMLDGYLVVMKNNKYGVIDTNQNVIIEAKYDRLLYSQNAKEFFAYANSKAGLIDKKGNQLIKPSTYQDISILDQNLDQEHRLYKVTKDGRYGVVTRKGEELIHPLFNQIGLDETADLYKDLDDTIILFEKFIPIKQDNGWGFYNIETGELGGYDETSHKFNFAGIGCDISKSKTSANQKSAVLIPKEVGIKGVVLMYQSGLYGIYDCNANRISVTCMWSSIYADTSNKTGETSYYLELNGEKRELKQFLEENGLITENDEEEDEDENTETSGGTSFTEEMNNLSTKGKLNETSDEDEQYFEDLNNEDTTDNPEENNTEDDNTEDEQDNQSPDEGESLDEEETQ